jgi:magnesium-transporting ATPase (P-type)
LKRKVVVRSLVDKPGYVRIYVKGAPEYILEQLCSMTLSHDMNHKEFPEEERLSILENVVSAQMAQEGLKVLSYAFKDMLIEDFQMMAPDVESPEFRFELERDLVYLGTFALEDPLRSNIDESI